MERYQRYLYWEIAAQKGTQVDNLIDITTPYITLYLSSEALAKDLDRDTTPEFKLALIRELFKRDPALKAEIMETQ